MNKLLRLTLILFMWFNAISYADTTDLKLEQVREYSYYSNEKLSIERIYDKDEILRITRYYYYGKYGIVAVEERSGKYGDGLFAYEYENGNLVKIYKTKKVWNYSNGTTKYEAIGDFRTEYEYDRYGNLVYVYKYAENLAELAFGVNKPSLTVYKTKYEYDSNGKITWVTFFENDEITMKAKCGYDSGGKLTDEKAAFTGGLKYNVKLKYDGNRLYSTNIESDKEFMRGKTKYEYNSAGQLIRSYKFGDFGDDIIMCRHYLTKFAN